MRTPRTRCAASAALLLTPFILAALPGSAGAQTQSGGAPANPDAAPGQGTSAPTVPGTPAPFTSSRAGSSTGGTLQWFDLVDLTRRTCATETSATVRDALGCNDAKKFAEWVTTNRALGSAGMPESYLTALPTAKNQTSVCKAIGSVNKVENLYAPSSFRAATLDLLSACGIPEHPGRIVARLCREINLPEIASGTGARNMNEALGCRTPWYVAEKAKGSKIGDVKLPDGTKLCDHKFDSSKLRTSDQELWRATFEARYNDFRKACDASPADDTAAKAEANNALNAVARVCERDSTANPGLKPLFDALQCDALVERDLWKDSPAVTSRAATVVIPSSQRPLCDVVLHTPAAGELTYLPNYNDLRQWCDASSSRAAVETAAVASFVAPILQGAGDFLKDRAKEELLAFAVEQLGQKFCAAGDNQDEGDLADYLADKRKANLDVKPEEPQTSEKWQTDHAIGTNKPEEGWSFKGAGFGMTGIHWSDPILASRSARTMAHGVAVGYWALDTGNDAGAKERARLIRSHLDLTGATLLPETCAAFLPDGVKGAAAVDAIHSGELQRVLAGELMTLPIRLLSLDGLPLSGAAATAKEEAQLRIMAYTLAKGIVTAVQKKQPTLDFLSSLDPASIGKALDAEQASLKDCKFEAGKAPSMPCALGLVLTTVSKSQEMITGLNDGTIPGHELAWKWVDASVAQFCTTYGGVKENDTDENKKACVWGGVAETKVAVWNELRAMTQAVVDFNDALAEVKKQYAAALKSKPPFVAGAEAAESVAAAVDALTGAVVSLGDAIANDVVASAPAQSGDDAQKALVRLQQLKQVTSLVHEVLKGTSAATRQDYRAVAASMNAVLNAELVAPHVKPEFKKGLSFVLALGTAKTRDDVRQVLEEHAAPAGSYRAKYLGTNHWFLNGFVGLGGQLNVFTPWREKNAKGELQAPQQLTGVPLSAPIGVDATVWHGDYHHIGFTFTAIDPLALRLIERPGQSTEYNFDGVLTPGAFFRWGMARSPVVLMLGARWQPLLRSVERNCGSGGNQACWQGPVSLMANLAVDVPIYPLD
jgi:hypothetical protein